MTTPVTRKVKDHTNVGTLQEGDVLLGERVSGTTVLFTVPALSGGGGAVDSVNSQTGVVVLDADDIDDTSTTNKFTSAADESRLAGTSGTNTGDQTSIVGITGTKAEFNTAVTDGNILYVGDITQYTDEMAQDAVGSMTGTSLKYDDAGATLQRAALTGDVTASQDSNVTTIANSAVTLAKQADMATASVVYRKTAGSGAPEINTLATLKTDLGLTGTNSGDQTTIVGITGTKAQFNTAATSDDFVFTSDLGSNVATFLATPSSANLAAAMTDETGTSKAVFSNNPAMVAPTADNFIAGYVAIATAAGTTTLTVASNHTQVFTGSTTQTVVLPVVSTLVLGTPYTIINLSSGIVTVQSSGANAIQAMAANTKLSLWSNATSGTGASVWYYTYTSAVSDITGSGSLVRATSPTFVTPLLGTPTSGALTNCTSIPVANATGILAIANGGNGVAALPSFTAAAVSGTTVTNGTYTKIQHGTENSDNTSAYDNATNYRFTPLTAGTYLITATNQMASTVNATYMVAALYKNGVNIGASDSQTVGTADQSTGFAIFVAMNGTTDYVENYFFQNSGSSRSITGTFGGARVGP